MSKKDLSEREICTRYIYPALTQAGWTAQQIREEVTFTHGQIMVRGKLHTRGETKRADYILYYKKNLPLAVIEAKDNKHTLGAGMQQALGYAECLQTPFVISTKRLSNIAELKGGFAYKSELFTESGKNQVIRMGNVRPDFLRLNEKAVFINDSLALETADAELFENDMVITMTGTRGKKDYLYTALVTHEYLNYYKLFLNQRLTCIRVGKEHINSQFLSILLKVDSILQPLFDSATGTANQANVGMLALANTIIPLSPLDEQIRIVEKVNQIFSMIDQFQVLQSKLQKTKLHLADALVANAVEGV